MEIVAEEHYLIDKAKNAQLTDPFAAKAWILAAKTLFPNNFNIQFEAYIQEKASHNHLEAAKCFSYIVLTFQSQPAELWNEVNQLTSALRIPEGQTTSEQEFYVKMFQHISYDVQLKILVNLNSDNNLNHCKFILLLLKRFPQAIQTHSPRLLETLVQGTTTNQPQFIKMLVLEALPLVMQTPPDLPANLLHRILALTLEYYITQMFLIEVPPAVVVEETVNLTINDCWQRIFEVLDLCARVLKWDAFLPYNKHWNKDVYWQKLIQIVSSSTSRPSDSKQLLFYGTILFVMSLQHYFLNVTQKIDDVEVEFVLLEGYKDVPDTKLYSDPILEPPHITVHAPCSKDVPICFVTAAQCWQLLHSNEILQIDFTQLLRGLPCSKWVNRFLIDLAFYAGRPEEAQAILNDTVLSNVDKNMRLLSLSLQQQNFTTQTFDFVLKILSELPTVSGHWMPTLSSNNLGRHLILLPLTKRAILQYCTKMIVKAFKNKLIDEKYKCGDTTLGNLLVLLQLDWPNEKKLAETVFGEILAKGHFTYLNFSKYITCVDFIEEFMYIYMHGNDVQLEFAPPQPNLGTRRIGTRGADKGVKDDFKHLLKQQIARSSDDIESLIIQFFTQEHAGLVKNIFDK